MICMVTMVYAHQKTRRLSGFIHYGRGHEKLKHSFSILNSCVLTFPNLSILLIIARMYTQKYNQLNIDIITRELIQDPGRKMCNA
jgi:hypothetical protein